MSHSFGIIEKFKRDMRELFEDVTSKPLTQIPFGREFLRVMRLCRDCQVQIDGNFSSLVASLVVVEGMSRALNGNFDILAASRPLLAKDREFVMSYLRNRL
jgi:predicted unusual protein kinase regulating ubiquinone biosynthesis (AarF/ABC1/UbiB family)